MIEYTFSKKIIWENESPRPIMKIKKSFSMLEDLANGHLQTTKGIATVLKNIEKVRKEEKKNYSFGGSDACIIEVTKNKAKIIYNFGEEETSVSTYQLLKLLRDWQEYIRIQ